ncbi:hypothetical protein OS493_019247 [Desmophyllum pertusum]|uniref:Cytochrome P450 n=1 Tax=Desmophyllum pertusum TaxID=174260 RepID=A0A9W9YEW8_9CNID|nr:hypothetical protein OS493_019247 [Desmophyllum pertusum]
MFKDQKEESFDPATLLNQSIVEVIGRIIFNSDWDITDPDIDKLICLNELGLKSYKDFQAIMLLDFFSLAKYFPFKSHKKIFGIFHATLEIIRLKLRERELTFDPQASAGDLMDALLHSQREAFEENKEEKASIFSEDHLINTLAVGKRGTTSFASSSRRGHLTVCGYRVPRTLLCIQTSKRCILILSAGRARSFFNPYRHIDKEGNLITNQGNFYPFGAGRRVCPGETLAKMEMYMFLSWMLHKFTFLPEEGQEPPQIKHLRAITQYPAPFKIRAIKIN